MYNPFHEVIYDGLAAASIIPFSSPYFCDSIAWIPTATREGADTSRATRGLNLFIKMRSPAIFAVAARVLTEEIKAGPPEQNFRWRWKSISSF
jgi:hypothetical protein